MIRKYPIGETERVVYVFKTLYQSEGLNSRISLYIGTEQ